MKSADSPPHNVVKIKDQRLRGGATPRGLSPPPRANTGDTPLEVKKPPMKVEQVLPYQENLEEKKQVSARRI